MRADVAGRVPAAARCAGCEAISRYRGTDQRRPELRLRPVRPQDRAGASGAGLDLRALAGGLQRRRAGARRDPRRASPRPSRRCGFRREAFYPCYGLAEATLFVAGGSRAARRRVVRRFDADGAGAATAVGAPTASRGDAATLVGCGAPLAGPAASAIVDPETGARCAAGPGGRDLGRRPERRRAATGTSPRRPQRDLRRRAWPSGEGAVPAHRRPRLRARRRAVRHRPAQGPDHHPRPQPLPAGRRADGRGAATRRCAPAAARRSRVEARRRGAAGHRRRRSSATPARRDLGRDRRRDPARGRRGARGAASHDVVLVAPGSVPKTSSGKIRRARLPRRLTWPASWRRSRRRASLPRWPISDRTPHRKGSAHGNE